MPNTKRSLEFLSRHRRLLVLLSVIPLFEVITAFGTAPDTVTLDVPQQTVATSLTLPQPVALDSGNFDFWR
jgi:hypothetical protein